MTNFGFLKAEPHFAAFADTAAAAEQIYRIDPTICVSVCRQAMEFAVKWMYSVDGSLKMPYQDRLVTLLNTEEFKAVVGRDLHPRLEFIRKLGNRAIHNPNRKNTEDEAALALENLFYFCDFLSCCYGEPEKYRERRFDRRLLEAPKAPVTAEADQMRKCMPNRGPVFEFLAGLPSGGQADTLDTVRLIAANKPFQKKFTARRRKQGNRYVPKPIELTEYATRKIYIDTMLRDAGWREGEDWKNEYPIKGMPGISGGGRADYVLFGSDGLPLAVVEAKRTCEDVAAGRQQAKLYADLLERESGRRPLIFLSNGFDTRIWNDAFYPERPVSGIYSKRDLEKEFNKLTLRTSLRRPGIRDEIAGRYYQKEAVRRVCESLDRGNRRKALLVMATGSGKTRTVISLVDVLLRHGWIKNVLFLADRNSLVTQAKRAFVSLLPDLSVTNLCEDKESCNARCVFSTYQTMMNCIDEARDEEGGRLFTCGHFDLLICDEAHRSIYKKYKDIFTYFDSFLIGLTATPKDEIDRNTYEIFELENGVPTYGYELSQAVKDGYLVDFRSVETKLKFLERGISYEELSESEKEEYEEKFTDEDGELPDRIENTALNEWVFNTDTIREVLDILMTYGIHVDAGSRLGKTIIFAKNHNHAEKIYEIFGREFPNYPSGFCRVIDNRVKYAQSLIDEFSDPAKLPQIAVSVDMLDTGIDIPECVNLVFFKKVLSKAKFWQMIGRGTRTCEGLIDGKDKAEFLIFDFCNNFEFFRISKGRETQVSASVQERIFNLKTVLCYHLQGAGFQTEFLMEFRGRLAEELCGQVKLLNRDNFSVRQHLKYVDRYSRLSSYLALTYEHTLRIREEVAPLILPPEDEINAVRFDALIYAVEAASLTGQPYGRVKREIQRKAEAVSAISSIPEINGKREILGQVIHTDYLERAGLRDWERIREELRSLMKYLEPAKREIRVTGFEDAVLNMRWSESELENDDLANYRAKAAHYIREHQGAGAIGKLRANQPLTAGDLKELERILWSEIGSRQDYEEECGGKPLGIFVREITGLDMAAAKEAFSHFLSEHELDARQIYFVNQIIEYIVQNGVMEDKTVLQESPFADQGSFAELFDTAVFLNLIRIIDGINRNATAA